MTANIPERFREVEPLDLDRCVGWAERIRGDRVYVVGGCLSPAEARALRDWLTKALPEEKP